MKPMTSSLIEIYLTGLVAYVLQDLACISPFGQMTYGTTTYQERRSVFCLFLRLASQPQESNYNAFLLIGWSIGSLDKHLLAFS